MSYCSENKIPADVSLGRVIEVIELLGYIKVRNPLKTKAQVAFYVWNGDKKSISFAGSNGGQGATSGIKKQVV